MLARKLSYFADFVACPVASIALLAATIWREQLSGLEIWVVAFSSGIAGWTLVEYAIHRWIYHGVPWIRTLHQRHHENPQSYEGSPAFLSVLLIFTFVYAPLLRTAPLVASGATAGMLIGYLGYMTVHHLDHFHPLKRNRYFYRAWKAHARHHHARQAGNFGVTTAFWDRCFGTVI
jgi:sterol desaturase/sphingolipid hydroxylase (fatty acid hydroxylase superfamily)